MPPFDDHLQMRSIDVEGTERSFWIPDRRPRGDVRMVIALHGRGETGLKLARRTRLPDQITAAGMNVVFPDALERLWDDHGSGRRDGADDDQFFSTLLEHLRRRGEFGEEAPYVIGYGENGAAFAERIAREGVHDLAGVILHGGTAREASRELTPAPVRPVPMIIAAPPRSGARRPGLRARLALNDVRGNAVVSAESLLADWQRINTPHGVETTLESGEPEAFALLTRLTG